MMPDLAQAATVLAAILTIAVLVVLPGRALARHLLPEVRVRPASVAMALGITWLVLASQVLLYARWWKPAALIPASLAVTALANALPAARPKHGKRSRNVRSTASAIAVGLVVLATAVSMATARYSNVEIATLQHAWDRSSGSNSFPSSSATSILQWLVLPMREANAGTLLASRWLGFALSAAAIAFAYRCVAARVRADRRMALVAFLAAGVSLSQAVRFMDVATVGAPFLFAGMTLLVRPPRGPLPPVVAGFALGIAALSAPTSALAAAGVLITVTLRALRPANPADGVAHAIVSLLCTISATVMSVAGTALAAHAGIDVPGFAFTLSSDRFDHLGVILFATVVVVVVVTIAVAAGAATWRFRAVPAAGRIRAERQSIRSICADAATWRIRAERQSIRSIRTNVDPMLLTALIGSVSGVLLADAPLDRTALVAVLVALCCVAEAAWPPDVSSMHIPRPDAVSSRPTVGAPRVGAPRVGASRVGAPRVDRKARADRAAVGLAIVAVVGSIATAALASRHTNTAQLASLRVITEQTTSTEWVLRTDPSVPVMRRTVGLAEINRATMAVVRADTLAANAALRATLDRDFDPTPVSGVWMRVLALSTGF